MKRHSLTFLWIYLRPFAFRVLLLSTLILASIGLQLYAPQIIRRFLDTAQAGADGRTLSLMGAIFLAVVVCQKIVTLYSTYLSEDLGWAATNRLRADLAVHTMRLDMGFHKLHTPGEIIERIDGDVGKLAEYFSQLVVHVLGNALLLIGVLVLLFREDWRFGLIGLAYALVTIIFLSLVQNPMVRLWAKVSKAYAQLSGYLEERFGGTEDIRANSGEAYVLRGLYPLNAVIARERIKTDLFGGFTFSTSHMFYILTLAATLGLAATLFLRGELTIGAVYLMTFYIGLMESPIKYIRRQMGNLQRAAAARMLASPADLLVFDDLSSALDVETERQLWEGTRSAEWRGIRTPHSALRTPHSALRTHLPCGFSPAAGAAAGGPDCGAERRPYRSPGHAGILAGVIAGNAAPLAR